MFRHARVLAVFATVVISVTGASLGPVAAAADQRAFSLALGDAAFWSGPPAAPGDCGTQCWEYEVTVTEPGFRLRIGMDRPRLGDLWDVEVLDPDGSSVGSFSAGTELYSAELARRDPQVGTYVVQVTAVDVQDLRVRLRAALEADDGGLPAGHVLVPPNLQALPPWDFSFLLPVTNGSLPASSTGVPVPGGRTACHPEEVALYKAVRCLRMAYGVGNVGLGPLQLEVGAGQQLQDRPLIQRVRYADGAATMRSAGNAYYHHSHMHYHHDRAIGLELFRVTDAANGTMQPAAEPHRKGFAHRNEILRDWTSFYPIWQAGGFGLLPGWGDYYEWDRPGNYIDFGLNADGLYLVRLTADPDGFILETNPDDNVAYSLIRVTGERVEHLESGRGTDPWDPCRIPLPLGSEFEDSFALPQPRPEHCPD